MKQVTELSKLFQPSELIGEKNFIEKLGENSSFGSYFHDLNANDEKRDLRRQREAITPENTRYYSESGKYHTLESISFYQSKVGFDVHQSHLAYFSLIKTTDLCARLASIRDQKSFVRHLSQGYAPRYTLVMSNQHGQIQQVRFHTPLLIGEEGEKAIKYVTIKPTNTEKIEPILVPRVGEFAESSKKTLVITEGQTKAFAISHCGYDALNITGVTMWQTMLESIRRIILQRGYHEVLICFDTDSHTNPTVRTQQIKLAKTLSAGIVDWRRLFPEGSFRPEDIPKGIDDLCCYFREMGIDRRDIIKRVQEVFNNPQEVEITERCENGLSVFDHAVDLLKYREPTLYCSAGGVFYQGKNVSKRVFDAIIQHNVTSIYQEKETKNGKQRVFPFRDKSLRDLEKHVMTALNIEPRDDGSMSFSNGRLHRGDFQPEESNGLSYPYSYEPNQSPDEEPTELIEWLKITHGNLDYRYWLRSLFDNSIQYGAILGVSGKSGSGKSCTLKIAQKLLRPEDHKDVQLAKIETQEQIGQLGLPRLLCASDCKNFPADPTNLYKIGSAEPVTIRELYSSSTRNVRFYTRIAFAYTQLPHIADSEGGFLRRFRELTCTGLAPASLTAKIFADGGLLDNVEYQQRVINWALQADKEATEKFMDINACRQTPGREVHALPDFAFMDRICTLDPFTGVAGVSIDTVYEAYCQYMESKRKRACERAKFVQNLENYGFQIKKGGVSRTEKGSIVVTDDHLLDLVDHKVLNLIERQMPLRQVNCRYREQKELFASEVVNF